MRGKKSLDLQILTNQQMSTVMLSAPYFSMFFTVLDARDVIDQSTALDRFLAEMTLQFVTEVPIGWRVRLHKMCLHIYIGCLFGSTGLCRMVDTGCQITSSPPILQFALIPTNVALFE